jgi:hypothetical protein
MPADRAGLSYAKRMIRDSGGIEAKSSPDSLSLARSRRLVRHSKAGTPRGRVIALSVRASLELRQGAPPSEILRKPTQEPPAQQNMTG